MLGVGAGSTKVTATALQAAVHRVNSRELQSLQDEVKGSEVWQLALSTASNILQTSSKDEIADEKLLRALAILRDERMPKLTLGTESLDAEAELVTISNFGSISDMSVIESLDESMTLVAEATTMWSTLRAEQSEGLLGHWAQKMVATFSFLDDCLWLFLDSLWGKGGLRHQGGIAQEQPRAEALEEFGLILLHHALDVAPLSQITDRFRSMMETMPARVRAAIDSGDGEKVAGRVSKNIGARDALIEAMAAIADLTEEPGNPTTE